VQFHITGALLIGAIPGVYMGAHVSSRAADHVIRPILAMVLVVSGLKMLHVSTEIVGAVALVLAVVAVIMIRRSSPAPAEVEPAPVDDDSSEPAPLAD
jgi:uncharacterized protein